MNADNTESMVQLDSTTLESFSGGLTGNPDRNSCPYCGSKEYSKKREKDNLVTYCAQCGKEIYAQSIKRNNDQNNHRMF